MLAAAAWTWDLSLCQHAGLIFAGMAVVSLVGVMPAAHVADSLGRKWTIMPSCLGLAAALCIMAKTGLNALYNGNVIK